MKLNPNEHDEAVLLVQYLNILVKSGKVIHFGHVPQESTYTKHWGTYYRHVQEGVKKGIPDYIIVTPLKTIFIELKRIRGGVVSDEQEAWILALNTSGCPAQVCKGFDQAKEFIDSQIH